MDKNIDLLVVILDANPVWWGQAASKNPEMPFTTWVDSLMLFLNTFLMGGTHNKVAVIATHAKHNRYVYPKSTHNEALDDSSVGEGGKYEGFGRMEKTIRQELHDLILNDCTSELSADCILTGALSMALCYVSRISKELKPTEKLSSRILAIKGSKDNSTQYMNFMSIVFTAQKMGVKIDACILDNDSTLLKQATDHLDGIYLKLPQLTGTLEYLLYLYLPNASTHPGFSLPPSRPLGHKAACFCHRKLINQGFICSVCLSIFCMYTPFCPTCHSTFKSNVPQKIKMIKK